MSLHMFDPCEISVAGELLWLLAGRAVFWPRRRTLIVADTHFGKDDLFRRAGIALPRGPVIADLQRLGQLLDSTHSERLVVLGDFLHAATQTGDSFLHAFAVWRASRPRLVIDVIGGNHDRRETRARWQGLVDWHQPPRIEAPFVLAHEPEPHVQGYVLAGHLHPVVHLPGRFGGRVPVFWVRRDTLVLPSFGSFTGGFAIRAETGEQIYAVAPEKVVKLAD